MGIFNLSRFFVAVLFAAALSPALAATNKPNYFYNAATKTWIPSSNAVITPQGTIINNSAASQAQRFLNGQGGFVNKSTVHANFPSVKKRVPITINAKTPASTVKLGAKNILKGGLAGIVLTAGLNELLNSLSWIMGEGGKIQKKSYLPNPDSSAGAFTITDGYMVPGTSNFVQPQNISCPAVLDPFSCPVGCQIEIPDPRASNGGVITASSCTNRGSFWRVSGLNPNRATYTMGNYVKSSSSGPAVDVPASEIDSGVDSSYVPHIDDWEWLAPYMDPSTIEITDLPRLMSPPVTKTIYDADGNPVQVSETNIWHDFDIRNNDSAQPEIDVKTTEETKVYDNGELTSTSTTTSTSAADPDTSTSGGDDFEIPTDCDFMPTVCAFIDWFKDDDLGDDPDLKSIMKDDEDFSKTKTISFGAAVCPAPHTINLPSLGMSVDLSFEFFCQFAEYARALVLAAAYIFAAYISLGVARG